MQKIIQALSQKLKVLYSSGALHITAGTFFTKFVAFFGSIFVVRLMTKQEYALVGFVETIYSYALIFAGLGLCYVILRYVVVADENKKKSYFDYTIKHCIIRDCIIAGLLIIANFFIKYPESYQDAKIWVPVIALLIPLQDLVNDGLFTFRAFFKNKQYAYWSVAVSVFLILGRIAGALAGGAGGVIISRVVINGAFAVLLLMVAYKLFSKENQTPLDKSEIKTANIYALQYMLTNGLWAIFMLNDVFLLGIFGQDSTVLADYKVAYVLPGNISIFATAIGIFVGPYFTKNENNRPWIKRNFKKIYLVSAAVVAAVALVIFVLAKPLILFMYGQAYANTVGLMRVLLIAAFLNSGLRYTTANILASMGQVKYNMIISAAGMVLQIILDVILIRSYQGMGVAVSSCIVYAFMATALFVIFIKKYYLNDTKNKE